MYIFNKIPQHDSYRHWAYQVAVSTKINCFLTKLDTPLRPCIVFAL